MYECPNCNGNLKFDIATQYLVCGHCDSRFSPYERKKDTDTTEYYEANRFICPQCGGEMISGDNDATAFCSYCGSANILSTRISKEKAPSHIIPFKITKEYCKKAYARKMRKAFFAPKEYKSPEFIDGFRGIYMPYHSYCFNQKGPVNLTGKTSKRKGDYIYTDHYDLTGDLDAYYRGFYYDASTSFYDSISESVAPFNAEDIVPFTPSFLSGFYADVEDVKRGTYLEEATKRANNNTYDALCKEKAFKKYSVKSSANERNLDTKLHTEYEGSQNMMYPVWFMSYRNGDKVAYATVNGQTGKVVADMPVDIKKYTIGSLLLALPIFFLLNLLFTFRPVIVLGICMLLATIVAGIYKWELGAIHRKETYADDKALFLKHNKGGEYNPKKKTVAITLASVLGLIPFIVMALMFSAQMPVLLPALLYLGSMIATIVICVKGRKRKKECGNIKGGKGYVLTAICQGICSVIALLNPVHDYWYYGGVVLLLLTILWIITDILRNYNRLAMRPLPQFEKKGGDDNA